MTQPNKSAVGPAWERKMARERAAGKPIKNYMPSPPPHTIRRTEEGTNEQRPLIISTFPTHRAPLVGVCASYEEINISFSVKIGPIRPVHGDCESSLR